jgi:hypothetical protein
MRRAPAKLIAIILAVIAASGIGIVAASAQPSAPASHHGTEHVTFMLTSSTGVGSIIATGLFTDGGTMGLFSTGPSAEMKLGGGTIWITPTGRPGFSSKTDLATCLRTLSEHGTYKLSHGTGRFAGIHGSGHFTATDRTVSHHKRNGGCVTNHHPLAIQAIITFSGPATLRR